MAQSTPIPRDVRHNVSRHVRLATLAADRGARLVLFPELSLTGYDLGLTASEALAADDRRLQPLHDIARARRIVVVAGAPVLSAVGLHIAALAFAPTGVETYFKQYLHSGEEAAFAPGAGGNLLSIVDQAVGLAICADVTHPEHAAEAARRGATIYAASCFFTESGYAADTARLQRYAAEHRILVLMANYGAPIGRWSSAGRSAIWADDGKLLACAPPAGEALVIAERRGERWMAEAETPAMSSGR